MLDNIKFLTTDLQIINKLSLHRDFIVCRPKNNYYYSVKHKDFGIKLSLDFRKSVEAGKVIGFGHLEINISPHYHFNQYRHNGNDFTPENCINVVLDILIYLGLKSNELNALKVVNLEFGLNIIPRTDINNLVNGLYFYKKTPFKVGDFPYFKKTNATSYKLIKAYAKGLQFSNIPEYGIDINTFRFEVKTKQSKNVKNYGIQTATDLLKLETYGRLGQTLLDEWENVLIANLTPDLKGLKDDEVKFITDAKTFDFWKEMIQPKYRNKFGRYKEKYHSILGIKNNLHNLIKLQIIDKLFNLQSGANSTQRTLINKGKDDFQNIPKNRINLESAPPHQNNRVCLVTELDISMQKKGSKFLCYSGLKYYKKNEPEKYNLLTKKYLNYEKRHADINTQIYYLAHNIRNAKTNKIHNQKKFEKRNYCREQLQFNF